MSFKKEINTWNYRVLVNEERDGSLYFQVHSVYYTNGVPHSYGKEGARMGSEDVETLGEELKKFTKAINEPILWEGDRFPEEYISE